MTPFATVYEARGLLLSGALLTIEIFIASAAVAAVFAFAAGFARAFGGRAVRAVAVCYVEFFRGTSSVVQLFWLYFALPFLGVSLTASQAAIIGLGLCHGAYGSEVVRGAILSVPKEQWEAATALNFPRWRAISSVVLPQAFLAMLPPFANSLIFLLKGTSIASIITVPELTAQSTLIVTRTLATTEVFSVVLLAYFGMSLVIAQALRALERALSVWRR